LNDWGSAGGSGFDAVAATMGGPEVDIELVGRFHRLSDRVNHGRGFILLHDARLLKRNGDPTPLVVKELYVNQDEVTFLAMSRMSELGFETEASTDRPSIVKETRRYIVFTPGHVISGLVHVYTEMSLSGFVDSSDPRFIPMTHVSARSLADRRVVSHFDLLLVNRTQMTAVALAAPTADAEAPAVETT
jgi:hypothetical protein